MDKWEKGKQLFLEKFRGFVDRKYADLSDRKRIMIARSKMMRDGKHTDKVTANDRAEVLRLEKTQRFTSARLASQRRRRSEEAAGNGWAQHVR